MVVRYILIRTIIELGRKIIVVKFEGPLAYFSDESNAMPSSWDIIYTPTFPTRVKVGL